MKLKERPKKNTNIGNNTPCNIRPNLSTRHKIVGMHIAYPKIKPIYNEINNNNKKRKIKSNQLNKASEN